jgi:hypothetical protein
MIPRLHEHLAAARADDLARRAGERRRADAGPSSAASPSETESAAARMLGAPRSFLRELARGAARRRPA